MSGFRASAAAADLTGECRRNGKITLSYVCLSSHRVSRRRRRLGRRRLLVALDVVVVFAVSVVASS